MNSSCISWKSFMGVSDSHSLRKAIWKHFPVLQDILQAFRQIATSLVVLLADWTWRIDIRRDPTDRRIELQDPDEVCRALSDRETWPDVAVEAPDKSLRYTPRKGRSAKVLMMCHVSMSQLFFHLRIIKTFQNSYSQNGQGMPIAWSRWLLPAVAYVILTGHSCCCSLRRPQVRILETRRSFGTFQGNGDNTDVRFEIDSSIPGLKNDSKCVPREFLLIADWFLWDEIYVHMKGSMKFWFPCLDTISQAFKLRWKWWSHKGISCLWNELGKPMAFIASHTQFVTLGEGEERRGVVAPGDRFRAKELPVTTNINKWHKNQPLEVCRIR